MLLIIAGTAGKTSENNNIINNNFQKTKSLVNKKKFGIFISLWFGSPDMINCAKLPRWRASPIPFYAPGELEDANKAQLVISSMLLSKNASLNIISINY